jgi:hypothetical protein
LTWEEEEADLTRLATAGSDDAAESRRYFELLFSHMHRIISKRRSGKNLFDDFKKDVLGMTGSSAHIGEVKAIDFVENLLVRCSNAYELILKKAVQLPDNSKARSINSLYLRLLDNIPNTDWQPIAIAYLRQYRSQLGND